MDSPAAHYNFINCKHWDWLIECGQSKNKTIFRNEKIPNFHGNLCSFAMKRIQYRESSFNNLRLDKQNALRKHALPLTGLLSSSIASFPCFYHRTIRLHTWRWYRKINVHFMRTFLCNFFRRPQNSRHTNVNAFKQKQTESSDLFNRRKSKYTRTRWHSAQNVCETRKMNERENRECTQWKCDQSEKLQSFVLLLAELHRHDKFKRQRWWRRTACHKWNIDTLRNRCLCAAPRCDFSFIGNSIGDNRVF